MATIEQTSLFALPAKKKKPMPINKQLFGELCVVCDVDWREMTKSERGRFNRASSELTKVGATVADVAERAAIFKDQYSVRLTPTALAANWAQLEPLD